MRIPPNVSALFFIGPFLCLSLLIADPRARASAQQSDAATDQNTARGIELYQQHNATEAIRVLSAVVKKHPNDPDAWYYLALALNSQGAIGAARPAFEHLISLRPDSAEAHAKLGYALILANEPDKAIAVAKRAIELGAQGPEPHYTIAEASFRAGDLNRAIEEAEFTLRINPNFSLALITESLAYYSLKQYSDAEASLERFLARAPNDVDADTWRGQLAEIRNRTYQTSNSPALSGKEVTRKVRILEKPEPQYTESARMAAVTGTVVLRAIFDSEGEVKHILVTRALPFGLTTKAIIAARRIKFVPAVKDDRLVSMYMQLEYNFYLY